MNKDHVFPYAVILFLALMIGIGIGLAVGAKDQARQARNADRLIGYGCGPDKLTFTAAEEDHFPDCERIEENPHATR